MIISFPNESRFEATTIERLVQLGIQLKPTYKQIAETT